jgi:hypothetical protein
MIVMAVIGGVIVVGLAWAGWYDHRRRGRGVNPSVEENLRRQQAIDGSKLGNAGPDPGGGSA